MVFCFWPSILRNLHFTPGGSKGLICIYVHSDLSVLVLRYWSCGLGLALGLSLEVSRSR